MNKHEFLELQRKFAKDSKRIKYFKLFNYLTTFLSILGVLVVGYYFINSIFLEQTLKKEIISMENKKLKNQIIQLQNKLNTVDTVRVFKTPSEEHIIELEKKIDVLNNIILDNPEKSLTIPLMRKDIDNIQKGNDLQIELIKDKVDTVIDLNKWILGLIFSLLVTIVLSNLSKVKSKNNNEE